jgi:hypothetical protein
MTCSFHHAAAACHNFLFHLDCCAENYCRGLELLQANRQELTAAVLQRHWKARGQQLLRAAEMLHVSSEALRSILQCCCM